MDHLLILGWHNVRGTRAFPSGPGAGARGLHRQFEVLRRAATVVDLPTAFADLAAGRRLPRRAVAITFDDGYRDNLELAVPLLEHFGFPATFFLVPAFLDGAVTPWWERLAHAVAASRRPAVDWDGTRWPLGPVAVTTGERLAAEMKLLDQADRLAAVDEIVARCDAPCDPALDDLFLDWDGARALRRPGITIGAHSRDHAILANQPAADQAANLCTAREVLCAGLDEPVDLLAYPNGTPGTYDGHTIDAARASGYRGAVTTLTGWNDSATDPFELRRHVMYPERGVAGFRGLVKHAALTTWAART